MRAARSRLRRVLLGQGHELELAEEGMGLGRIEIVVEIERVGRGAVDEGSPRGGESGALADGGGAARAPAGNGGEDLAGDGLDGARDGDRDRIDERATRRLPRLGGPVGGRFGEPGAVGEDWIVGHRGAISIAAAVGTESSIVACLGGPMLFLTESGRLRTGSYG